MKVAVNNSAIKEFTSYESSGMQEDFIRSPVIEVYPYDSASSGKFAVMEETSSKYPVVTIIPKKSILFLVNLSLFIALLYLKFQFVMFICW